MTPAEFASMTRPEWWAHLQSTSRPWAFLHSASTWRYDCHAGSPAGADCWLLAGYSTGVAFPRESRYGPAPALPPDEELTRPWLDFARASAARARPGAEPVALAARAPREARP